MTEPAAPKAMTPVYEHDCDQCVYLGTVSYQEKPVDLYACSQGLMALPTVIARYSDEPSDYESGLHSAAQFMLSRDYQGHPMAEALRRAVALVARRGE